MNPRPAGTEDMGSQFLIETLFLNSSLSGLLFAQLLGVTQWLTKPNCSSLLNEMQAKHFLSNYNDKTKEYLGFENP